MTSYIVVLRLKQTSDEPYSRLSELLITRLRGHCVQGTTWLVDVRQKAPELKQYLAQYLASDETVYVAELTQNHEFCRLSGLTREWVNQHPPLK